MQFSIGSFEILVVVGLVVVALILFALKHRHWRWPIILAAMVAIAAGLTPADLLSTAVLSLALSAVFAIGFQAGSSAGQSAA